MECCSFIWRALEEHHQPRAEGAAASTKGDAGSVYVGRMNGATGLKDPPGAPWGRIGAIEEQRTGPREKLLHHADWTDCRKIT
jgi:hypothetical protein